LSGHPRSAQHARTRKFLSVIPDLTDYSFDQFDKFSQARAATVVEALKKL
jgi:hypothetical protein